MTAAIQPPPTDADLPTPSYCADAELLRRQIDALLTDNARMAMLLGTEKRRREENKITIRILWPDRRLNPNARVHWTQHRQAVQAARDEAYAAARNAIPAGWEMPLRPMLVCFFHPPSPKALNDVDNLHAALKPSIDGFCQALGINDRCLRTQIQVWGEPHEGGMVILQIKCSAGLGEFLGLC